MSNPSCEPPSAEPVLAGLKDFQRLTVDHVFRRLYTDSDASRRFLIADEVGLGKTLVARGVVAKAVEHLWNKVDRIDIVYVCSNGDIARQNVKRLTLPSYANIPIASRITMLPVTALQLDERLNFVTFTPSTSLDLKRSTGIAEERALLYWLLRDEWQFGDRMAPINVLQCGKGREPFRDLVRDFRRCYPIDAALAAQFRESLRASDLRRTHDGRATLQDRFASLSEHLGRARVSGSHVPPADRHERDLLIGEIRNELARACIEALEPDLVILDEFQRFKHLLSESEMGDLAKALLDYPDVRVLLLSATPYKMYTLSDESAADDHYEDFLQTLEFLFGHDERRAREFSSLLDGYRRELLAIGDGDHEALLELKASLEGRLRKVMVRTERLASSLDRHGMLEEIRAPDVTLQAGDIEDYLALQRVATCVGHPDTIEYWKSSPYLLNFMESYELKSRFERECELESCRAELADTIERWPNVLLDWRAVENYEPLEAANARLRSLLAETVEQGVWQQLWIAPSLPYYQLGGPFATPEAARFTKKLVFSSWEVVPKAIATLVSYEAERRVYRASEETPSNTPDALRRRRAPLLRFQRGPGGRLMGMPVFGLLYPSPTLASELDPLRLASGLLASPGRKRPTAGQALKRAQEQVAHLLSGLDVEVDPDRANDEYWYWAAPILLDLQRYPHETRAWFAEPDLAYLGAGEKVEADDSDDKTAWLAHLSRARELLAGKLRLGQPPKDLVRVLATAGLAGPGNTSLRALARASDSVGDLAAPWLRSSAVRVAWSLRNLFNLPESMAIVRRRSRGGRRAERYWRQVADYCLKGCLQAVLDEYAHVLRESLGLFDESPQEIAAALAVATAGTLSLRTVTLRVDDVQLAGSGADATIDLDAKRGMRAHFAMRFGNQKAEDGAEATRASQVRDAFNSPFWPFVLSTTSVGQEGLDFHLYCHAVVHWNLPSNPVDLEQREGRVHRYKGHAVRKNLARQLGGRLLGLACEPASPPPPRGAAPIPGDIWEAMFEEARQSREAGLSDLWPYWIYTCKGGAAIERHVPFLPLSRDADRYETLRKSLAAYRMVFGQARQEDLVELLLSRVPVTELAALLEELTMDLSPPLEASNQTRSLAAIS